MEGGMSGFCIKGRNNNGGNGGTKCGRWNPTTEQVKVLTDLFRSGLRTPSTDQIQKISSQLSFYGKIESKNVFYWFQNHKARERQKRRRISPTSTTLDSALIERSTDHETISFLPSSKHLNHYHHNQETEHEIREIETLQLFPLNSYEDSSDYHYHHHQPEKFRFYLNNNNNGYSIGKENDHPPLDLCLSFM